MQKNCEVCGREFDALYTKTTFENHEVCKVCKKRLEASGRAFDEVKEEVLAEQEKCSYTMDYSAVLEQAKSFPATTGMGFEGYKITEYLGVTGGETALGTGLYTDFASAIYDITGTESPELTNKIRKAKDFALAKLIDNCKKLGANAVIGVNFELVTINSVLIASANGTAVRIEVV